MIHSTAEIYTKNIGKRTTIWQFSVVLKDAVIGSNTNICSHCFIENEVIIGNNVTIKQGTQIWDGTTISDNVFIGPNVTFTNDLHPKSKNKKFSLLKIKVMKGVSIGANSTLLAGITIEKYSLIGAGSLVTKDIPEFTVWYGSPAVFIRAICQCDNELSPYKCFKCK